ncbi:MAG: hypothetical protein K2Q21_10725 [Chitinophagaceae bacterium]|nr:hypothetical protein [Chitinophagaceae bacterium]
MAKSFDTSLKNVAIEYLKMLQVRITATTIKKNIEEHPDYPSIVSLCDFFRRYNIQNEVFELDAKYLDQLPAPFIALLDMPVVGKDFVLVKSISNNQITYSHKSSASKTIPKDDFLKLYQSIVCIAEPDEMVIEESYKENLKSEKKEKTKIFIWAFSLLITLVLAFLLNSSYELWVPFGLITIIKLLGNAITILLLIQEVDKGNVFVKNICTASTKSNCDAILESAAAKIFGISWAEIGFFYFSSTLLLLFFPDIPYHDKVIIISIGNSFAIPYVLYSILYQSQVAKQWCPLCLAVQVVLILELLWSFLYFWHFPYTFKVNALLVIALCLCLLLPMIVWYGLKTTFAKAKDSNLYRVAYKRLQNNQNIFNSLLKQQPLAAKGWDQLGIAIGNNNPTFTILKVCNPYCGPCAKAHPILEELLKENKDLQVRIIFSTSNSLDDKMTILVKHLLAIAGEGNTRKTQKALDDWYLADKKDYDQFIVKYPISEEILGQQNDMIGLMYDWCSRSEISYTPTFFINGYLLPENYSLSDLKQIH